MPNRTEDFFAGGTHRRRETPGNPGFRGAARKRIEIHRNAPIPSYHAVMTVTDEHPPPKTSGEEIRWLSTAAAAKRLGITNRTLYRFIDEGLLPAYRFGRVIRLQQKEVDAFIQRSRIEPGTLEHLYPESTSATSDTA
jgi:excisionase family DNA binding protein